MTDTIIAPWTSEQVAALEAFQTASGMHPFTCGGDQHSLPLRLVPSHSGWYCPDPACGYRQDWAHAFMADPEAWSGKAWDAARRPRSDIGTEFIQQADNPDEVALNAFESDLAADVECAIGLNTGGGGADGVHAARDAVLAVRDQEVERLRARLNRVQVIADRLAVQGRLGVDLEADSIRRGIAQQLHDALGAQAG
ncbi:hypothetical protein ACH4N4_30605 [Streptomyces microflavus]|uniref:hypothetical protein n=1 Tax=Streptomyces microflavus TaxID=1919 RepID=UPI003790623D